MAASKNPKNPNFSFPNPNLIPTPHMNYHSNRPPDEDKRRMEEGGFTVVENRKNKAPVKLFEHGERSNRSQIYYNRSELNRSRQGGLGFNDRRNTMGGYRRANTNYRLLERRSDLRLDRTNKEGGPIRTVGGVGQDFTVHPSGGMVIGSELHDYTTSMDPKDKGKGPASIYVTREEATSNKENRQTYAEKITNGTNLRFNSVKQGTWREVALGTNQDKRRALNFYDPYDVNDIKVALIGEEAFKKGGDPWKSSIVLYVVGPRPRYHHFKAYAMRTWKPKV